MGDQPRARPGAPQPPTRLAIGVVTYRRPGRLRELLPMLVSQLEGLVASGDGEVIVVDNDPEESARPVVETGALPSVRYCSEPERGISPARNRVLDEAGAADLLVFIDDDETPREHWLRHLVETRAATGAAAVAGAVVSRPDGELHPFVAAGGFVERAHRSGVATGAPIERAATNNLLLDLRRVRALSLRFDPRFALTGGEDSLFTSQLTRAGELMVWCADAIVVDHVPAARMTPDYMLSRARTMSNSSVFVELALRERLRERWAYRATAWARETARAALAGVLLGGGRMTGSLRWRARGARAGARARGAVAGLLGRRAVHYAETQAAAGGRSPTTSESMT